MQRKLKNVKTAMAADNLTYIIFKQNVAYNYLAQTWALHWKTSK